jgi:DNA-binding transcriptional LysR family regulator
MPGADFEGWDLFVAVAEAGSFAGAARARGVSVPTVSRAIARLEARLGGVLFHRSTRRLALSSLGQDALAEAQALVAAGQRMEARLGEARTVARGVVRLGAPLDFGRAHLAPLLPDFLAAYPELEVELNLDDARIDIVASGHDLVLRIGRLADSTLIARRLCPVARIVVASPAYLARAGRPAVPADLTRHACLLYSNVQPPGLWLFEGPGGVRQAVTVSGPLTANSGGALNPALLAGMGIALQPDFLVAEHLAAGRLEALLPGWESPALGLYLVTPPSPLRPHRVRLLIDFLAARLTPPPWAAGAADRPAGRAAP